MALKKILGLDIGTTSVGWAVSKELENGDWTIDDFGVHIFNEPVDVKKAVSFAAERRNFRSKRRLTRRKVRRIRDLKYYLEKYGSIKVGEINDHFLKLKDKNQNKGYKYSNDVNPYFIRKMAIEGKRITWLQFAIALINIAKRRGYDDSFITKSSNSEEIKNDDSYFDKINLGKQLIKKYKYPIIALENLEIFADRNKNKKILNKDYKHIRNTEPNEKYLGIENNKSHDFFYFSRIHYFNEVKEIIRQQEKNLNLSKDLIKRLIGENESEDKRSSIIFRQRPFEDGPGDKEDDKRKYKGFSQDNVGNDIFLNKKRMWSSLIINDLFILLCDISKIGFLSNLKREDLIKFNQSMVLKYFDFAFKDKKTFENEFLSVLSDLNFKKERIETKNLVNFGNLFISKLHQFMNDNFLKKGIKEIKEFVFNKNKNLNSIETNKFILDEFGNLIAENITPWLLLKKLKETNFYSEFDQIKINNYFSDKSKKNKIVFEDLDEKINYVVSQFPTIPSKVSYNYACMALDAFLFDGKIYGDFQAEFNKKEINNDKLIVKVPFGPISDPDVANNPMVMRALSQARKVVKELYKEYKWFDSVVVESARNLTSSLKDRKEIKKQQDKNYDENLEIFNTLEKNKIINNDINRKKIKLYNRQNGVSIYSGQPIDVSRLEDYEIDHIIPRSKINDDSFDNIVLVSKEENQLKKNRTPLEAGAELLGNIKSYTSRCYKLEKDGFISKRKYAFLMAKSANDEIIKKIASRELNDTRYISKYFTSYLKKSIQIYQKENKEYDKCNFKVFNPTGSLTSAYRKAWLRDSGWGLEIKTRDISHFHHAVDAIILSNMVSESRIKFYTDCLRIWNLVKEKNQKNLSEEKRKEAKKALDDTYKEILDSWKEQNYGIWFPRYKERFENIINMKFTSFVQIAPPIVGSRNLQLHVDERIPVKLIIEKKDKSGNIIKDGYEKNVIWNKEAKLDKIIWEEEYNNEEIKRLKKLFPDSNIRYPFISFKQNNKIRGSFAGSENYIPEKEFNDSKKDKNNYKKTKNGIISLSNYYGVLLAKSPNKKIDFIKLRKLDIIEKYNFEKNDSKKIDFKKFYNQFLTFNRPKNSKNKIVGILRPGTIFKGLRDSQWKICVYRGVSGPRVLSPYIFIPAATHKNVTDWIPVHRSSYFLDIKIIKIDILGRKIN